MRLRGYLVGAFPRTQSLIKSFRDNYKGKISYSQLMDEIERSVAQVVKVQVENNLYYIMDGMLAWDDLLRPITYCLDGVEVDGLSRWFDNNFFYKKPVVKDKIIVKQRPGAPYFNEEAFAGLRGKAVLPEPFTMARLSENKHYRRLEELAYDLAHAISELASSLRNIYQIQLTAPTLVFEKLSRDELEIVRECIRIVKKKIGCELLIHMPFGSAYDVFPYILDSAADVVGLDQFKTPLKIFDEYSVTKGLYVGVLDGRNTLMEDRRELLSMLETISAKTGLSMLDIGPTCELEFLPYEVAVEKVKLLGAVLTEAGDQLE